MSALFSPYVLGALELANRIVVAPMCQYSCGEGLAGDWHRIHLGQLALSGAGLLIVEATAVTHEGRITPGCLGLWSDAHEAALARVLAALRKYSAMPIGIQLAHAGRKGSCEAPWRGGAQIAPDDAARGGWRTLAPSALPHAEGEAAPSALDEAGLARIRAAFVDAGRRAHRLGLAAVELHAAHGYLLHQFLSPLANRRSDGYGGSLANRMRFPLEVFDALRAALPPALPLGVRISASDFMEHSGSASWTRDESTVFARALHERGAAYIHVSGGGLSPLQQSPHGPGCLVPYAEQVRAATGAPTIAVGLITEPEQAEAIVAEGRADLVALGRALLFNPHWPWAAAVKLGARVQAPPQYWRAQPSGTKDLFLRGGAA
ncbi:MAG: oxidoreductase [Pseudomonadota bacterium]|nr:NADH:flavin oxidoreductase/NADH oxidase [Rubrivivax sp.]NLZ40589.1 NADH:flavin oxidoreductase/NADH oxidase [Comamonadaceae bacterium]